MKLRFLVMVAVGFLVAADRPRAGPAPKDQAKFQGTWKLVSLEVNGQEASVKDLGGARLVIKGEKYNFTLGQMKLEMTFAIKPGKKPKAIDLKVVSGPNKGKVYRGIYTLEGDTFKICRHTDFDKERPTEFATRKESGLLIVVWERQKP